MARAETVGEKKPSFWDVLRNRFNYGSVGTNAPGNLMSSVLITHPYHLALDSREARLGKPYPPLSTLNAATLLKQQGHQVVFIDRTFEQDESDFGLQIERHRPDFVAVMGDDHSVQMKQCIERIRRAHQAMARQASERGIPVLVSGPDVSDQPEQYLKEERRLPWLGISKR